MDTCTTTTMISLPYYTTDPVWKRAQLIIVHFNATLCSFIFNIGWLVLFFLLLLAFRYFAFVNDLIQRHDGLRAAKLPTRANQRVHNTLYPVQVGVVTFCGKGLVRVIEFDVEHDFVASFHGCCSLSSSLIVSNTGLFCSSHVNRANASSGVHWSLVRNFQTQTCLLKSPTVANSLRSAMCGSVVLIDTARFHSLARVNTNCWSIHLPIRPGRSYPWLC